MFENMDNLEVHGDEWIHQEQAFNREAKEIKDAIHVLYEDAALIVKELYKLERRMVTSNDINTKKQVWKESGTWLSRLRINTEGLAKIDKKHEELKLKVIKFYHLPPEELPPEHLSKNLIGVEEMKTMVEQWKRIYKEITDGEEWKE